MASLAVIIVAAAVLVSMSVAMAFFIDYRPEITQAAAGERVRVGPNTYSVSYQGTEEGGEEAPGTTFAKVAVDARGPGGSPAQVERRQLGLVDKEPPPTPPSHGTFGEDGGIIAYFPLQGGFDEQFQYTVMIRPTKEQASPDLARVCIANC